MYKRITILLISLFLIACSARSVDQAQEAYQAGNYQKTILILTDYLDKKGELPSDKERDRIFMLMANIVEHYKLLAENRSAYYEKRVEGYEGLLFIRKRINNKYYEHNVYTLTEKYNVTGLSRELAQQYYLWGKSIQGNSKENYRLRSELFKKSIDNYEIKDASQLYLKNHQRYATLEAADRYQAGKQAVSQRDYPSAAENFLAAADIYQPYGNYKDSRQLGVQYDKQYRQDESNQLYHQATQLIHRSHSKADYRQAAIIFQQAYDIYAKYGQVNDAQNQYQKYSRMGQIHIYVNGEYRSVFEKLVQADFIRYVNSAVNSDLMITVNTEGNYYRDKDRTDEETLLRSVSKDDVSRMNDNDRNAFQQYIFTRYTVERRNRYVLKGRLQISGLIGGSHTYQSEQSSSSIETYYKGNVPPDGKYKSAKRGELRSEYRLRSDALREMESNLKRDIDSLALRLKSL